MTTLAIIKISFLVFYKRIFVYDKSNIRDPRNLMLNILIGIIMVWDLGFTITMFASCRSDFNAMFYTKSTAELAVKCIETFGLIYAYAISDFIVDCFIIIIPAPMIWKLHLPFARKLGVSLVFLMGIL